MHELRKLLNNALFHLPEHLLVNSMLILQQSALAQQNQHLVRMQLFLLCDKKILKAKDGFGNTAQGHLVLGVFLQKKVGELVEKQDVVQDIQLG
jgi:hypothetical protein